MTLNDELKGLRAAIGFFTNIPVNIKDGDFEQFTKRIYLFIIAAAIIGVILGTAGFLIQTFFPAALMAIFIIACIYLLTGINHMDGLSDMADGIIASGSVEKKIKAMKDVHAGTGGLLFIVLDLLFLHSAISLLLGLGTNLFFILLVAEICAKTAMTTVATFGKSIHTGMGSLTMEGATREHYAVGLIMALGIVWVVMGLAGLFPILPFQTMDPAAVIIRCSVVLLIGLIALGSSIVTGLIMLYVADQNFGGANGDVIGASNEVARIVALIIMGILMWTLL
ncbi:adenosylcobinamide-GDP ribazoletransferase [Methanocella sp. CWC-04]|uniref:Adenosylcobinamide-GDP ribazoletransferase n=1 Tax=Methanooceanicella nereidis TaxID=2052831 RepID=A0AAP2RE61_9EURY|nr:adenosylcobinamide-GDP ribazoletransferase [Methanocella sp. CWC-04]MCD1295698.1 adenosylcobinamide-GDP ribazoletransferase [Methanocella sp. CWC-04]